MADLNYTLRLRDLMSRKLGGVINNTRRLDGAVSGLQRRIVGFGAAFLGGQALIGFGKSTIEALKNYEYFSASLRTLMGGDEKAASALQTRLIEFAKVTPFSLLEVQAGTKQLLAMGASFDQVLPEMKMLGDISAGLAVPMERLILNFGQVRVQGKLTGRELRDFSVAGVPLLETLADTMGKTKKEIAGMVSAGDIGFDDVKDAMEAMTAEGGRFFKLMEQQSKTVGGRLSNLGDSWEQMQAEIGKSQSGMINSTVTWAAEVVGAFETIFRAQNKLETSFAKFGAQQFTNKEKFLENADVPIMEDRFAIDQAVIVAAKGGRKSLDAQAEVFNEEILDLGKRLKEKEVTGLEFSRLRANLLSGLEAIAGEITLLSTDPKITDTGDATLTDAVAEGTTTGVEVSGRRPQNINISIESLVEQLNITSETVEMGIEQMRESVSRVLLETVNDANQAAK